MRIKAFSGVSVYTFHAGISARQRARESVARRKMRAELSRFTPANASHSANHLPVSRIEFATDRSCNYVRELVLDNKLVTPAGQTEVFVPASLLQTFNLIYSYRQLAVRIVVSAIADF